jgi:O-methyltransferase involved in polyketide biosynthesis
MPTLAAVWLLEGFPVYLPSEAIIGTLGLITELSAAGSRLGFDAVNGSMLNSPWTKDWIEMQAASGAPWIGAMDDPIGTHAQKGWKANCTQPGGEGAHYGRYPYPVSPISMTEAPRNWLVTAVFSH